MVSVARNVTALVAVSGIHQTHMATGAGVGVYALIVVINLQHLNRNLPTAPLTKPLKLLYIALPTRIGCLLLTKILVFLIVEA